MEVNECERPGLQEMETKEVDATLRDKQKR